MRTKITLLLVFLNVALFFYIFTVDRPWDTDARALQARRRVLGPEAANIQHLVISQGDATTVTLRRENDDWLISTPFEWPANPHAVNRIINELQFLEHRTSFAVEELETGGQTLADYGLETPAMTVTFGNSNSLIDDAENVTLAIGKSTEIENNLYVLSPDGSRIHVVGQSLAESLAIDLADLRAETCFTIPVFEVRSLNLGNVGAANARVRLRLEGNRWSFEAPIVARAAYAETKRTLDTLIALRTTSFAGAASTNPNLLNEANLNQPFLRVTLEGNSRRETLLIGSLLGDAAVSAPPIDANAPPATVPDQVFYGKMETRDALFTVALPASLVDNLREAQVALRDRHILDLEGRGVTAVSLSDNEGHEITLQRLEGAATAGAGGEESNNWQLIRRAEDGSLITEVADPDRTRRLLTDLEALKAERFERDVPTDEELERWGLTQPTRTVVLSFDPALAATTSPTQSTLLLGVGEARDNFFAKITNQTFVYRIPPEALTQTRVDPLHYRARLLRELPPTTTITGIALHDLQAPDGEPIYQHALAEGETWESVLAQESDARSAALTTLGAQLRTLRADRFVAASFSETSTVLGERRPWRYRLDATLSVPAGTENQTTESVLYVAERDGGNVQLVGSSEFGVVFHPQQAFIDALWALTYAERDPGPTQLAPAAETTTASPTAP